MKHLLLILLPGFLFYCNTLIAQDLIINEVMPSNGITSIDYFDDTPDWIEVYNNTGSSIQLSDYYLSDSPSNKLKWQFPTKNLQSNKFILIYCSGRDTTISFEYHSNFKLSNSLDTLGIYYMDGSIVHEFSYDSMPTDVSYGLQPDGGNTNVYFNAATPKATNNNAIGYNCILNPPMVSLESGFYSSPLALSISHPVSGVQFHYSEDGEEPEVTDPMYNIPFSLTTSYQPNRLSIIPTNPGLNAPQAAYSISRMNNRGYLPPATDVQNINLFMVKAFKSGCIPSESVTKTYVLDDGNIQIPNMPILSLQTDSFGFFSNDTGIYVFGNSNEGNYTKSGYKWERVGNLVYFDENQNKLIDQKLEVELHGNGSRQSTHKNLRVSPKSILGNGSIDAALFEEVNYTNFDHLILRSPGHRPDCMPRDELATSMVAKLGFDVPYYSTSVMYLNGEYWGINVLKERFDDEYIAIKYDMNDDDIVILEDDGALQYGEAGDTAHYYNMMDFVTNNSLDNPSNMAYLNTQMDMGNYVDYMISEIFIGNGDWPTNNMRFWRKDVNYEDYASPGHDGRWRWMFFDIDGGFGGSCDDVYYTMNNLERALMDTGRYIPYTRLFRDLTSYQSFREFYINRTCDRLNTNFLNTVTRAKLDVIVDGLDPEMMDHVNRFGYPSTSSTLVDRMVETPSLDKWNYLVSRFETFMSRRDFYIRRQMKEEWTLADTFDISINVNDANMGYVQINSLELTADLEGVSAPVYPWTGMYFEGIDIPIIAHAYPGYRFKEWLGLPITKADTSVNISSDTLYTALFEIDPNYVTPMPITINELQAWNTSTVFDEYFEYDDWIELYNPNATEIDITGYYLTDDRDDLKKYWIGANATTIAANEWMVFWTDDDSDQGQNHTNFKLSKDGEFVALVAPDGVTVVDSINFGPQLKDYSFGRQADGMAAWVEFEYPTPFYSNLTTDIQAYDSEVALKVYPNPSNGDQVYFNQRISGELYNISGVMVYAFESVSSINVSSYKAGIYIVRNANTGVSVKLIIQ